MRSINSIINNPSCRSEAKNRRWAGCERRSVASKTFFSSVSGCSSLSASVFPTLLVSNAPPPSHLLVWSRCGCLHSADVTNMSVIPAPATSLSSLPERSSSSFLPLSIFPSVFPQQQLPFYLLRLKEKSSVPP